MTPLQTRLAQADKPTKGPEMTTNNPDPLEVWREACGKYEDAYETGGTLRERVILGDQAAAAIIAQHYAPVIAENERLREALRRYGDRIRMAMAPAELQQTIDDALGAKS